MTAPPPELLEFLYRYDRAVQTLALGLRKVVHEARSLATWRGYCEWDSGSASTTTRHARSIVESSSDNAAPQFQDPVGS